MKSHLFINLLIFIFIYPAFSLRGGMNTIREQKFRKVGLSTSTYRHWNTISRHSAKFSTRAPSPQTRPQLPTQKQPREDNVFERLALGLACVLLSLISPNRIQLLRQAGPSYKSFVKVTKMMLSEAMIGSWSPRDMSTSIQSLLRTVLPLPLRNAFKDTFKKDPKYLCEASSLWMSFGFIEFLVGKVERFELHPSNFTSINLTPPSHFPATTSNSTTTLSLSSSSSSSHSLSPPCPSSEVWMSGVKLTECRYLAESGCKSACINLCKIPTQRLFLEDLGLPLTMSPNYEDCSCEMKFGVYPPPLEEDPAFKTLCFSTCGLSALKNKAKKEKKRGDGDNEEAHVNRTDCA